MLATNIVRNVRQPPAPANHTAALLPLPMFLNDGNDKLTISSAPTGPVTVGLPTSTAASSSFQLDGGAGNDMFNITGLTANVIDWNLDDRAQATTITGDDTVFFQGTAIRWNSTVDGGPGYDIHTESNTAPRNNFKDANGNFILDNTPANPVTPPFTAPPRQGTITNPNGAELRYVNFENGQTRPPSSGGGGGGGGGAGGGARWTFRRDDSVVVSAASSPNLAGLLGMLPTSTSANEPAASIVNDSLLVTGTAKNDLILVTDAGHGLVRIRVGNRILGTFPAGQGIAIESYEGNDFVYVAPSIQVSTIVSGTATQDQIIGGLNLLLLDNGSLYSNQQAAEHPQFLLQQNPAAADMALLQILGMPQESAADDWPLFGHPI
jgi:hypothetical protein